jgi:D-alanine-D-alanine ligase
MAKSQKTRLCIVFGGRSGEHEVSLTSAASVISALDPEEYDIIPIGITKSGKLASAAELGNMLPQPLLQRLQLSSGIGAENAGKAITAGLFEKQNDSLPISQIFFPLLHGPYGEDGTFQGLLEMAGLPYIGCEIGIPGFNG